VRKAGAIYLAIVALPRRHRRHGHHHDTAGARSHNNRGRPYHHSTADPPLHITPAPRHPPAPRPPKTLPPTPPRCRHSNRGSPPRLPSRTTRGPARRGHKGTDPVTGVRIRPPMDGTGRGRLEAGHRPNTLRRAGTAGPWTDGARPDREPGPPAAAGALPVRRPWAPAPQPARPRAGPRRLRRHRRPPAHRGHEGVDPATPWVDQSAAGRKRPLSS
jgi:hypothetical protein